MSPSPERGRPRSADNPFADSQFTPQLQQAGRSSTSLHAEAAAAAIAREAPTPPRPQTQGSPSAESPAASPALSHSVSFPALNSSVSLAPSATRRLSSHTPAVSSPLNPRANGSLSSRSSVERRSSDERSLSSSSSPTKSSGLHRGAVTKHLAPPPSSRSPRMSEQMEKNYPYKAPPPTSIQDLGSDYTRYFNPFSDSRRSSWAGSGRATPLLNASSNSNPPSKNPSTTDLPASSSSPAPEKPVVSEKSTKPLNEKTAAAATAAPAAATFFPFLDDRLGAPYEQGGYKFPLYTDEKEDDDDLHMPYPDDDVKLAPHFKDHFSRGNLASTIGMFMMAIGLLFLFIGIPILSFSGFISFGYRETPLDQMWKADAPETWAIVNNRTYPLMSNVRTGLIDPDTPESAKTRIGVNGDEMVLVFSDEFNDNNRTFYEGDDPFWFAPDIWYGATIDLDWYDPDAVTTYDGVLELRLDQFPNHGVQYRSGMLNSWNHLCFKGGVFEVSLSLPGPAGVMGFWPGAWTMGNLGRPGYLSTTEGLWPYTYNSCDAGITPNQSQSDGLSYLPGQRLNACTCPGEDHPTPGTGRGAPEIDILEAGANGKGLGIVTQSFQVAPFDIWYYPDYEFTEFPDYGISYPNGYTGGPFQQALSATTNLNNNWYDGKQYQKYAFEYKPGTGSDGYIAWLVGDEMTWKMTGDAVGPNGNIGARQVSEEPMSIILNLGFSNSWTWIDWANLKTAFPAVMRIDYVRWYQPKDNIMVTCDPPGYETTQYIKDHINAYTNPNLTAWNQTGFDWPKNKLTSNC